MIIGITNSTSTVTFCISGRIIISLMFAVGGPPICIICMLCRTKKLRMAMKKYP